MNIWLRYPSFFSPPLPSPTCKRKSQGVLVSVSTAILTMFVSMSWVLTLAAEEHVERVLALVPEVWKATHLVAAEVIGVEHLEPAAFLAVPLGVVRVVNIGAIVGEKIVARLAD